MGRPTVWVLLGLTLLVVSLHDVQVGAEVGPSESECRPYIEKAINELKTVDSSDDSNEDVIPDTSPEIEGDSKESGEVVNENEQTSNDSSEENNEGSQEAVDSQENIQADGDSDESKEGNVEVTEQVDEIERESQENEDVTKSNEEETDDNNKSGEGDSNDSGEATEEEVNTENENASNEDGENSQEETTGNAEEEIENEVEAEADAEEEQQSQEEENTDNEADTVSVEDQSESGEITSETTGDEVDQNNSDETEGNDKEGSDESTEGDQEAVELNDDTAQSEEENNDASAEEQKENADDNDSTEATLDAEATEPASSENESANSQENDDDSNEAASTEEAPEEVAENAADEISEETTEEAEVNDSAEASNEEPPVEEEPEAEGNSRRKRSIDDDASNSKEQSDEDTTNSQEQSDEQQGSDEQQASEESQEDNVTEENDAKEVEEPEVESIEEPKVEAVEEKEAEVEAVEEIVQAPVAIPVVKETSKTAVEDVYPEDDLLMEFNIPDNLRDKSHIIELLHLDDESIEKESAIQKVSDTVLKDLKRIYENAIKPLEALYKYRDLSNRHFGDPEIFSKPLVLFMGPWSGGKSSIINYLTDNEYTLNSLRTGAEPSPAYFNILMHGDEPEVLDGTQLAADWTFSGLQKFGQGLEDRLRGLKLPSKILEKVNIVEIPGILEVRKQVSRLFPFNDACQWFIDRADIIFLVYDPSKLDVGPETEAILDQLKGREYQTRILLNKADVVKPEELMRVQGALIWNISPLMSSAQPPVMYTTSLWSNPYTVGAPIRLLQAQERALLRDLRNAVEKRIENKIASARRFAVRVRNHAKMVDCYLTTYYNHKSLFGNKKQISDQIIEHPQNYHIYEGLSTLTNISRYDLPDPDVYRDFFRLNRLYEFKKLSETCTYFRGCPINKLDIAIAYDLPELVGKYKKSAEAAIIALESNAAAATDPKGKS